MYPSTTRTNLTFIVYPLYIRVLHESLRRSIDEDIPFGITTVVKFILPRIQIHCSSAVQYQYFFIPFIL